MTRALHIADSLSLPLDFATETAAILAVKRAGKSNAAVVMAEEMFDAGIPWVAVDPKGDWWGVRAAGNGKAPGLPVIVFGGEHADAPLEPTSGAMMARLVATRRLTCVLDVSTMSGADMRRFLTDFAVNLYQLNREPMHLFCEEADEYIPQQVRGESARMVGAFEKLVKRGGFRGIGVTLVTQRSASLNKDVLTQAGTLIAMRTPSPQDRKAVLAWIEQHEASKDIIDELPKLQSGEAWVFSTLREPALQKIWFRRRRTFDSGATPKVGEKLRPPATLADVDLNAIRAEMATTIERAKADDPKELKKRIADLEKQLANRPAAEPKVVEVPILREGELEQFLQSVSALSVSTADIASRIASGQKRPQAVTARPAAAVPVSKPRPTAERKTSPAIDLPQGERATLIAAAQYEDGASKEQLTILTGYKRSSRDAYLQRLRNRGYVVEESGRVFATSDGIAALGEDYEPLPTGEELQAYWLTRLPEGERRVLEILIHRHPDTVSREQIDEETGYKRSSRDAYLQRLSTRRLVEIVGRGEVRASKELF